MSTDANLSLEQQVALLSPEEQDAVLADLELDELPWNWHWNARPNQLLPVEPVHTSPTSDWTVALFNAGRGAGKTRSGAEYIREVDEKWPTLGRDPGEQLRVALLGRTAADVRDTILNGKSGLLNVYPPSQQDQIEWIATQRRVNLPGGGFALCFSAEEPDQLRGPQFHVGWGDELGAYKQVPGEENLDAWTNLRIAVRLGLLPQVIATTTPRRVPILRQLLKEIAANPDSMLLRTGKTTDNVHLTKTYLDTLFALYGGTALGAQELDGEMLDAVAGATADADTIEKYRVSKMPQLPGDQRWMRLVSVDPSVADRPDDECGIVVIYAAMTRPILRRHAFVVEDASLKGSPTVWGDRVVQMAHKHKATVLVETNQGGALVRRIIADAAAAANLSKPPIREVWSTASKAVRAEPIGAAYARGRVHHLNVLPELEDQLTSWTKNDSGYSPDRMDAVVHGLAALLFPAAMKGGGMPGSARSHTEAASGRRVQPQTTARAVPGRAGLRVPTGVGSGARVGGLATGGRGPGLRITRKAG